MWFKGTDYYTLGTTYIWFNYYNELQNTVTLVSKTPSYHVITPNSPSRPHQRRQRPYILICHRWKMSWTTFRATVQINHRFHFFKLPRTSRSTTLSTACMKWNSLRAVWTLSLISWTSAACSSMMSFAHCGYLGSRISKYGQASLFRITLKAVNMCCLCQRVNKPPQTNKLRKKLNAHTSSGHTTYLIL